MADTDLENRLIELEIQTAWQDDTITRLSDTVASLQKTLDLQQAQLQWLYQRLQDKSSEGGNEGFNPLNEIPPHY